MAILFNAGRFKATDKSNLPIPGAFLSFYATLTSTPQPVYSDSALSILLTNPVQADSNGLFPEIWLDDSLPPYKAVFASPDANDASVPGSTIWSIPQYNASFSVATLTPLLNPQTPAEVSVGLVPVDFSKTGEPIDVTRHGILPNDSSRATLNTSKLKALLDPSKVGPVGRLFFPPSTGADVYYFNDIIPIRDGVRIDGMGCALNFTKLGVSTDTNCGFLHAIRDVTIENM